MKCLFFTIFCTLIFYVPGFAISEAEFQKLYDSSPVLQKADKLLNQTWKEVIGSIPKNEQKTVLAQQREWIKSGRDEIARDYLNEGYSAGCAYAIATVRWAKNLRVFEYNHNLSQEDLDRGAVKADDAFWDEDADIPEECRK